MTLHMVFPQIGHLGALSAMTCASRCSSLALLRRSVPPYLAEFRGDILHLAREKFACLVNDEQIGVCGNGRIFRFKP
jgi:hypothetical protein